MSDLRQDPITGQWVIISELRGVRPNEYQKVETRRSDLACAFCRGNEHNTPEPILELFAPPKNAPSKNEPPPVSNGDWLIRVVPNKYPAFSENQRLTQRNQGPYQSILCGGIQEIIIQSPRHVASFSQLTDLELSKSFEAFQWRLRSLRENEQVKHVMLFTNCRAEAGASLEHLHSQIIGTPIISPDLQTRMEMAQAHFSAHARTTMESVVAWEQKQADRIVTVEDPWVVFCPYASRFPYQIWIAPQQAEADFVNCSGLQVESLSRLVREVVDRLERIHDFPAYNVMFHFAVNDLISDRVYQWYVEIVPRLTRFAGYELGTGCWINHVPPVFAAQQFRELPSNFQ